MNRYRLTFEQQKPADRSYVVAQDTITAACAAEAQRILIARKWCAGVHIKDVAVEDLGELQPVKGQR